MKMVTPSYLKILQAFIAHGGSVERMKHIYLRSHSCLVPAVMWHVTHRMSVISFCCHLPVQTHLSHLARRGRNVCYEEQVSVSTL